MLHSFSPVQMSTYDFPWKRKNYKTDLAFESSCVSHFHPTICHHWYWSCRGHCNTFLELSPNTGCAIYWLENRNSSTVLCITGRRALMLFPLTVKWTCDWLNYSLICIKGVSTDSPINIQEILSHFCFLLFFLLCSLNSWDYDSILCHGRCTHTLPFSYPFHILIVNGTNWVYIICYDSFLHSNQ